MARVSHGPYALGDAAVPVTAALGQSVGSGGGLVALIFNTLYTSFHIFTPVGRRLGPRALPRQKRQDLSRKKGQRRFRFLLSSLTLCCVTKNRKEAYSTRGRLVQSLAWQGAELLLYSLTHPKNPQPATQSFWSMIGGCSFPDIVLAKT